MRFQFNEAPERPPRPITVRRLALPRHPKPISLQYMSSVDEGEDHLLHVADLSPANAAVAASQVPIRRSRVTELGRMRP
jgi:hypothetical protein